MGDRAEDPAKTRGPGEGGLSALPRQGTGRRPARDDGSPTRIFKAKLSQKKIASSANPNKDDPSDPESVVLAWARLSGEGIPADYQIPPELLLSTVEVHCKIRCGDHAMGYSLFYGVWEFIYEKVIFWF